MKHFKIRFCFLTVLIILVSSQFYAQTQSDLNIQSNENLKKADVELNNTYNKILNIYKDDSLFIKKLKIAQNAWIVFRDAYLKSIYPHDDSNYYGSDYPMCYSNTMAEITTERVKELKQWIDGTEEGDVCSGSIKTKDELKEIERKNK